MNGANARIYLQAEGLVLGLSLARASALCLGLVCVSGLLLAGSALALVGPSREAPEFRPYAVMVMTHTGGTNFCTAGVITSSVVITAAHCVTDTSDTKVFFPSDHAELVLFDVAAIAVPPDYKPTAGRKAQKSVDLALVRLSAPLPSEFKPLELAQPDKVAIGQRFRILGFGRASEEISGTSGYLREGVLAVGRVESPSLVKLVDPNGTGLGGCTGDSGAPILSIDNNTLVAVATQAKGRNGHWCGAATRAALISPQLSWIRSTLRSWGAAASLAQ